VSGDVNSKDLSVNRFCGNPHDFLCHPYCHMTSSFIFYVSLYIFLKLRPRKYKYNAYSIVSADILSRSNKLTEYRRISKAIVLSKLTRPYRACPLYNFRAKFD